MELNTYYFVYLRRNLEYETQGEEKDNEIGRKHFEFISNKTDSGDLYAAGPLDGAGGLYFFDAEGKSKEDILNILKEDDSIRYKMFVPEIHLWSVPPGVITFTFENLKKLKKNNE